MAAYVTFFTVLKFRTVRNAFTSTGKSGVIVGTVAARIKFDARNSAYFACNAAAFIMFSDFVQRCRIVTT